MTGCQAGFSILQMMNEQRKEAENKGRKVEEDRNQEMNYRNLKIIESLYEARTVIRVSGQLNESEKKIIFHEFPQQAEDANICNGEDLELEIKILHWMPAVQRIEVVYGLSLGK
ncbi:hypothetical protein DPV78_011505 [Talaromyces pinophilus]|nr:hypothetical protein DPV78_011505 [Talaromyces pinophilus]